MTDRDYENYFLEYQRQIREMKEHLQQLEHGGSREVGQRAEKAGEPFVHGRDNGSHVEAAHTATSNGAALK